MLTLLWKNFCWNDCNTKIKQKLFINDHVSVNYVTYTHIENYMLLATQENIVDACAHVLNSVDDDVPCRTVYTSRPDVAGEPSGDASTYSVNKRSVTSSYVNDNNRICCELVIILIGRLTSR